MLPQNLTEIQVAALTKELNLADGHAYRSLNSPEMAATRSAARRFADLDRRQLPLYRDRYMNAFFDLSRQSYLPDHFTYFSCFTASAGIEIIANLLRLEGLKSALIEPCFDNLKDILKRHAVPLVPISDELVAGDVQFLLKEIDCAETETVFLVSPNNPTGVVLAEESLREVARYCRERGKILILDSCFRAYVPREQVYDQYNVLAETDVDCIVIEDTGKTWPTGEIKAPFVSVSPRVAPRYAKIESDFLLHVPAFSYVLLTELLQVSAADDLDHIQSIVRENHGALVESLEGFPIEVSSPPYLSVAWLTVGGDRRGEDFVKAARSQGVQVLPGRQFYWSDKDLGEQNARVALVREPEIVGSAIARLRMAAERMWDV